MNLIYADIDIKRLQFGVNRPEKWWDKHKKHKDFQLKFVKSIRVHGLLNPLSVGNETDDGNYTVTVGNQRLKALQTMDFNSVPCICAFRMNQKNIPVGTPIDSLESLQKYFTSKIAKIILNEQTFHAVPSDVNEWDADKY